MRKIFVLDGHPRKDSFIGSLCSAFIDGAKQAGHEVVVMKLSEMDFDMNLGEGYSSGKNLESSLGEFQKNIEWCDHFVLAHPMWWGGMPAKTKGLIDRAFLPGFAFVYNLVLPSYTKRVPACRTSY